MTKYCMRPVLIDAFQMTKERRTDNSGWPNWLHEAWKMYWQKVGSVYPKNYPNSEGTDTLMVCTLDGIQEVLWDYWIVRDTEGMLYVYNPIIFGETYQEVGTVNEK